MKITKERLVQIIKEELAEVEKSRSWLAVPGSTKSVADPHTAALEKLADYIREKYSKDVALLELLQTTEDELVDFENEMRPGSSGSLLLILKKLADYIRKKYSKDGDLLKLLQTAEKKVSSFDEKMRSKVYDEEELY